MASSVARVYLSLAMVDLIACGLIVLDTTLFSRQRCPPLNIKPNLAREGSGYYKDGGRV